MALHLTHPGSFSASHPIVWSALLAVILIAAIIALTALFGFGGSGPSLELVPDPAGTMLPF